ncbi:olfactory receptor 1D2-like [Brienomyrus brachyistius]|uniref:olfactory receptor 1D2-like n=1 Tax=Brienomyrus brachyistius TaxID=42636 RepID=UPI0020B326CB|nr:olfactory receptor 1D2-like [Brienomyrus brachyistius]
MVPGKRKAAVKKRPNLHHCQLKTRKMEKFSSEMFFILAGLNETRGDKNIYFAFSFVSYLCTLFVNLSLILIISTEKILHEPMFIFLCNLCVNGIFGATGFYPKILIDLMSDSHIISYSACILQVCVVHTYILSELTNLTVMAYDRYVAICKPLEYHSIMTPRRLRNLILTAWFFPLSQILMGILLTVRLPLCGIRIEKVYCSNWDVVRLSCSDNFLNNLHSYSVLVSYLIQLGLIMVSYSHIIRVSIRSRAEQKKFMETCLPHLITLMNFILAFLFDIMYARYGSSSSLLSLRNVLSVEYLVVPPLLNPLIYGLKLKQIRRSVWRLLYRKVSVLT